ncbi:hypothetical protein EC988_000292 [Linderina pennispora]|nr:hypothetical protein EC988_000292 [Linderina pennispora]
MKVSIVFASIFATASMASPAGAYDYSSAGIPPADTGVYSSAVASSSVYTNVGSAVTTAAESSAYTTGESPAPATSTGAYTDATNAITTSDTLGIEDSSDVYTSVASAATTAGPSAYVTGENSAPETSGGAYADVASGVTSAGGSGYPTGGPATSVEDNCEGGDTIDLPSNLPSDVVELIQSKIDQIKKNCGHRGRCRGQPRHSRIHPSMTRDSNNYSQGNTVPTGGAYNTYEPAY